MRCKRCGHHFTPTEEGQEYGPTCAKKVAEAHLKSERVTAKGHMVIV